jgi:hypothetical protein
MHEFWSMAVGSDGRASGPQACRSSIRASQSSRARDERGAVPVDHQARRSVISKGMENFSTKQVGDSPRRLFGGLPRWRDWEVPVNMSTDESRAIDPARLAARKRAPASFLSRATRTTKCAAPRSMFVGRNRGGLSATACLPTNFTLEVTTPRNGIKLGTVRCDLTPRVRAAGTFPTQEKRRSQPTKRVNPSWLGDGPFRRLARLDGVAQEGQGGP